MAAPRSGWLRALCGSGLALLLVTSLLLFVQLENGLQEPGGQGSAQLRAQLQRTQEINSELRSQVLSLTSKLQIAQAAQAAQLEALQQQAKPVDNSGHKLALVVPFRKADAELELFVPHMHAFLKKQGVDFELIVVNQIDGYRFNRAALLNIGFFEGETRGCDYLVMHDVDLLPLNDQLSYWFPDQPFHLASPDWHPIYHYKTFIGGVLLMQNVQYRKVNGLSTKYWGWGREDDELYKRIMENGMRVVRPEGITTGRSDTFRHVHDGEKRVRDMAQVGNQFKIANQRDRYTGLNTTSYSLVARNFLEVEGLPYRRLDVTLVCDETATPWCKPPVVCPKGHYRHKASGMCRRCGRNCWRGFVLAGECNENSNRYCLKLGRDVSPEEAKAKRYKPGTMNPPPGYKG